MKYNSEKLMDIGKNLALITQMGIIMLAPVGLCIFVASWLIDKYKLGDGIMIGAIIIGILAGFLNIYKIVKKYFKS